MLENKLNKNLSVWALTDDRSGNRSQSLGVADALGINYKIKEISYAVWASLPNTLLGASFLGLSKKSKNEFHPPWPDLVISAGRRTAPVAKNIRQLSLKESTGSYLVHIMDPGGNKKEFGLIAIPRHDNKVNTSNSLTVTGAPHQITKALLDNASDIWQNKLDNLTKPWIALIVGGSTRRRTFTSSMAKELASWASKIANKSGGSLLIATSRRTGNAGKVLVESITAPCNFFLWDKENTNSNPYHGFLGLADTIIVTGDSTSMCLEACGGTKPVYIYAPQTLITEKHNLLHQELFDKGYARPLTEKVFYEQWEHPPLNSSKIIAQEIIKRLKV